MEPKLNETFAMHTPETNCMEQLAFEDCIVTSPDQSELMKTSYGNSEDNVTINESYFMHKLKTT